MSKLTTGYAGYYKDFMPLSVLKAKPEETVAQWHARMDKWTYDIRYKPKGIKQYPELRAKIKAALASDRQISFDLTKENDQ